MIQPPYAYVLEMAGQPLAVFNWPNACKKYIRDSYTGYDGVLSLPPQGYLKLTRYNVNPKAGKPVYLTTLDIGKFLEA